MNPFERAARAEKVTKLLALLPRVISRAEANAEADELASWDADRRRIWARVAGVNEPSNETWDLFVAAARARLTAEEIEQRVAQVKARIDGRPRHV